MIKNIYIVGAGIFGTTIAERISNVLHKKVYVIDKRDHIGGNCYSFTDKETGINCHKYGAHIFHTKNKEIYDYINQFVTLNHYRHQVLTRSDNILYQMPINLNTINKFFKKEFTPTEASAFLQQKIEKSHIENPKNLEEKAISLIGEELYEAFIKGYTKKQWQRDPKKLPASIITRLPFRVNYCNDYFSDPYQGIPIGGYTKLFEGMLNNKNIDLSLNTSYQDIKKDIKEDDLLIYTGMIDEYFDFSLGKLEWRSLDFKWETKEIQDYQGCAVVNEAKNDVPYTRTHEFKHFHPEKTDPFNLNKTIICKEFSKEYQCGDIPSYPINTKNNQKLYNQYCNLALKEKVIFCGRLGGYKYIDMDQSLYLAIELFKKIYNMIV